MKSMCANRNVPDRITINKPNINLPLTLLFVAEVIGEKIREIIIYDFGYLERHADKYTLLVGFIFYYRDTLFNDLIPRQKLACMQKPDV